MVNILEATHLVISLAILVVLCDDVYGFSVWAKWGKRRWRKFVKKVTHD